MNIGESTTILDSVCKNCDSQPSCSMVFGRSESFLPPVEGLWGLNESKKEKDVQINTMVLPTGRAGHLCLCLVGEFFHSRSSPASRRRGGHADLSRTLGQGAILSACLGSPLA